MSLTHLGDLVLNAEAQRTRRTQRFRIAKFVSSDGGWNQNPLRPPRPLRLCVRKHITELSGSPALVRSSFPNSVWERHCGRNSVSRGRGVCALAAHRTHPQTPPPAKRSFAPKCVPKQSLGTRGWRFASRDRKMRLKAMPVRRSQGYCEASSDPLKFRPTTNEIYRYGHDHRRHEHPENIRN